MQKADVLQAESKYREAYSALPSPQSFPEFTAEINKRRDELAKQFATSLFNPESNV